MTLEEFKEAFRMGLKLIPKNGMILEGEKEPSDMIVGYYHGLEMGYRTALELAEKLEVSEHGKN